MALVDKFDKQLF